MSSVAGGNAAANLVRGALASFTALLAGCSLDSHFLYHPQPYRAGDEAAIAARFPAAEAFVLQRPDGVRLHGWLTGHRQVPVQGVGQGADRRTDQATDQRRGTDAKGANGANSAPGGAPTLRRPLTIYFGGNAEEASWMLTGAHRFAGRMFLFINYRGYGGSSGTPHEKFLLDDALAVVDAARKRSDVDPARVSVWGRSLGTGVAVHVASARTVSGVVLVSPYDSMAALAQRHMPAMSMLLTQRYDSAAKAPAIRAPALMLAGARDTLIPPQHSEQLRALWGGPARLATLPDADHNSMQDGADYWHEITAFLAAR